MRRGLRERVRRRNTKGVKIGEDAMKTLLTALVIIVSIGTVGGACAQDFQKGMSAYETGDYATALREFKVLAELGHVDARFNLALMYKDGQGVVQDYKAAVKWYREAAEEGNVFAQYNLGFMYKDGQGITQDDKEAVKWLRKATEQGFADAQHGLGVMYESGLGVTQDNVYAHMWWNIAA